MRLLLLLSVLATTAQFTRGLHSFYPACTANQTKTFTDNLSTASDGCTASSSYDWGGDADPTDAQRTALCNCTLSAFDVPKCHWTKLGKYDVSTTEHFNFVYNCASTSGKTAPKVTEVPPEAGASTGSSSTTTVSTSEISTETSPDCTVTQLNAFTGALNTASGGCTTNSTYNWGGSTDPTEAQYIEICKCAAVTAFTIPNCFVMKGQSRVSLKVHYNWVKAAQCSTFSPSQGSSFTSSKKESTMNVVPVFGVVGGVVVVAVMIIVAFIVYKRNRSLKEQEQQYDQQRHYQMQQPGNNTRSPMPPAAGYQQKKTSAYSVHTA